jgi:hypothetical protein
MAIPTDRGYAILSADESGKLTVSVSVTLPDQDGSSQIFAEHTGESRVAVDPGIPLARAGNVSWTTVPVQVFVDSRGTVHVAALGRTGLKTRAKVH